MAKLNAKSALTQQRADIKRGSRHKTFIGDDTGSAQARANELAKVHKMQEELHVRREEEAYLKQPLFSLVSNVFLNGAKLVGAVVTLPFRIAGVLLRRPSGSES